MTPTELQHQARAFLQQQAGCEGLNWPIMMTDSEIAQCCAYVAEQINTSFRNHGKPIVLVGVLKGVYVFLADLTRHITVPHSVYFVEAGSYGDGQVQAGQVQLKTPLDPGKLRGHTVILVDELFDHGLTMHTLRSALLNHPELGLAAADVVTCVLFSKASGTDLPQPDIVGISELPNVWLVGYGLDVGGEKRGWSHLFACPKIPGVPASADDVIFEDGPVAQEAYARMRAKICAHLDKLATQQQRLPAPASRRDFGAPPLAWSPLVAVNQ